MTFLLIFLFYGSKIPGEPNPAKGAMSAGFFKNSNSAYNVLSFKTCNTLIFPIDNSTLAQTRQVTDSFNANPTKFWHELDADIDLPTMSLLQPT
jgi:hypothetical protein